MGQGRGRPARIGHRCDPLCDRAPHVRRPLRCQFFTNGMGTSGASAGTRIYLPGLSVPTSSRPVVLNDPLITVRPVMSVIAHGPAMACDPYPVLRRVRGQLQLPGRISADTGDDVRPGNDLAVVAVVHENGAGSFHTRNDAGVVGMTLSVRCPQEDAAGVSDVTPARSQHPPARSVRYYRGCWILWPPINSPDEEVVLVPPPFRGFAARVRTDPSH